MKYSLKCTCGDVVTVDAGSREEAVEKIKAQMGGQVDSHMAEKHPGEAVPSAEEFNQMVEMNTVEGDLSEHGHTEGEEQEHGEPTATGMDTAASPTADSSMPANDMPANDSMPQADATEESTEDKNTGGQPV